MHSYSYPLYDVPQCSSFKEFMVSIKERFSDQVAFKDYNHIWTYSLLYDYVRCLLTYFINDNQRFYYLTAEHPVYFFIAFFAITISGNTAILCEPYQCYEGAEYRIIDEEKIIDMLSVSSCMDFPEETYSEMCCAIAKSSGTTSVAKGVMLSQKNLLSDMVGGMQCYEYPLGAVYYHVLPHHHLFGLVADLLGPLYSGGTICFSDNKLNFFKDIKHFQPSHMNLPPAMIYAIEKMLVMSDNTPKVLGGRLKKIMCAGARLNENSRNVLKKYGIEVLSAYGLTECSPCISMNRDLSSKPDSVGQILPCCDVSIVDGEITVRGDNVMMGYWNEPEATNNTIHNGWLYTGDLGYLDEDGFLFLIGRKSNLIVFEDGTKVIPEVLENEIISMAGVVECLLSRQIINQRTMLKLIIVKDNLKSEEDITKIVQRCFKAYNLSDKVAEVLFSQQDLPKNSLGKIIRNR